MQLKSSTLTRSHHTNSVYSLLLVERERLFVEFDYL